MHTVDIIVVCAAVVVIVVFGAVLARQRQMLRTGGGLPMAVHRGGRWIYGVARYVEGELRWYRALGVATRPTLVFRRGEVELLGHRSPQETERRSLPPTAVVVEVRFGGGTLSVALGESAYTGFVSWLESSAPR